MSKEAPGFRRGEGVTGFRAFLLGLGVATSGFIAFLVGAALLR